jgi:hypothetical protein
MVKLLRILPLPLHPLRRPCPRNPEDLRAVWAAVQRVKRVKLVELQRVKRVKRVQRPVGVAAQIVQRAPCLEGPPRPRRSRR